LGKVEWITPKLIKKKINELWLTLFTISHYSLSMTIVWSAARDMPKMMGKTMQL